MSNLQPIEILREVAKQSELPCGGCFSRRPCSQLRYTGKLGQTRLKGLEIFLFERQHNWELRIMFEHEGDVGRIACHRVVMARKSLAIASKRSLRYSTT